MTGAIRGVRFGHVNIVAADWRRLAEFYVKLFGCELVPPERDYGGADVARGTGVADAALKGAHLRLPGHGQDGPTLEIYTYHRSEAREARAANRLGIGHLAFAVDDVSAAREAVLVAGGDAVGDVVTLQTADGRRVTWCYVTDPEGNIVELQSWAPASTP
jgi:glyoxylase I family protein